MEDSHIERYVKLNRDERDLIFATVYGRIRGVLECDLLIDRVSPLSVFMEFVENAINEFEKEKAGQAGI